MYVESNPKTKKALKKLFNSGVPQRVFSPGPFGVPSGLHKVSVEGPHYPEPHRWYASVIIVDGVITMIF
jgi:hypothetical protein